MRNERSLQPGIRVRLTAPSPLLELTADTGWVLRPDEWEGYFIIRLDGPARYRHADGTVEELQEIRESFDNVEIIPSVESTAPAMGSS
jgi:hypothetical protein